MVFMKPFIWVTGRAAVGKSTFAALAVKLWAENTVRCLHLSDEQLLFEIIRNDKEQHHHYYPDKSGRFLFRSNFPFDEGIRRINERLLAIIKQQFTDCDIVVIELARGLKSGVLDVTFARALSLLHPVVLSHSTFVYLYSTWGQQVERNVSRGRHQRPHTPEEVMSEIYRDDDLSVLKKAFPVLEINNSGSLDTFLATVREVVTLWEQ